MKLLIKISNKIKFYFEIYFKIRIDKVANKKVSNLNFKIPLKVYQVWSTRYFTRTHAKEIKKFRELNPDVQFNLMTHYEVNQYMLKFYGDHPIYNIFKKAKYYQIKADIFRYCILYERGGIWADIKSSIKIPLTQIFDCNAEAIISYEKNDINFKQNDNFKSPKVFQYPNKMILMWCLAFCKKNIILQNVIDAICTNYNSYKNKIFSNPKNAILDFTGTHLFTKVVKQEMLKNNSIKIQQLGIDFNGYGEFLMKGSSLRYLARPDYSLDKNKSIID
jgi:mannosyltransferase OCH1-like enzyme